jgi:hypothetical protein
MSHLLLVKPMILQRCISLPVVYYFSNVNVFPMRVGHPSESATFPHQHACAAMLRITTTVFVLCTTVYYTSDLLLSPKSSISTLHMRELCPILLQWPQYLSARTLFAGVLPSS